HCNRFSQITTEKGLDVGITTQILRDFHNKAFDTMILMSSNRDYVELLDFVRQSGRKVKLLIWRNTLSQEVIEFTNKWAIEVIYLDNHQHELEKEHTIYKEAAAYPLNETQEINKPLVSSRNQSDSERISTFSTEIKPEDLPHGGGLTGTERQTGKEGTPLM
ncbi:MAG: NYN domain-containing protein, partial [bacterium]